MGSITKTAVALGIILCCPLSTGAAIDSGFSLQPVDPCAMDVRTKMRHPTSRKYVTGPWPRFAKEMLA